MVRGPIVPGSHLASLLVQRTRFLSRTTLNHPQRWQNPNRRESARDLHQSGSPCPARFAGHSSKNQSQKCRSPTTMYSYFPFLSRV